MKFTTLNAYNKETQKNIDRFVSGLNKMYEKNGNIDIDKNYLFCSYKNGVIFGSNTNLTYTENNYILSAHKADEKPGIAQFFDSVYRSLNMYKKADFVKGSTTFDKKAIQFKAGKKTAVINEKLIGNLPKDTEFYIYNEKSPVLAIYQGQIIKIVLPIIHSNFVENAI